MMGQDDREATLLKIGLVQLIIVALLVFSLISQQKNLTLLLLVFLAFVYGARLWSRYCLINFTAGSTLDRARIFPDEEVRLTIRADNRKALPLWLRVTVSFPGDLHGDLGITSAVREQGLLWYQSAEFSWRLVPRRRGIYRLGPPQMVVGDLMGLYPREVSGRDEPLDLIVYPRLRPLRSFAYIKRDLFGSPGARSPVEDPVYLLGTRDYQAGSPSRYIHWSASARLNRLQERVFEPSRQARVLFVLDVAPFAAERAVDLFERTIEGLASLAVACDRQGFAVGLVTNGMTGGDRSPVVPVARSSRQATFILETLAGLTLQPRQDLGDNLRKMTGLDGGLSCVLFALRRAEGGQEPPAVLRQKNIPVSMVYCIDADSAGAFDPCGASRLVLDSLLLREASPV